MEPPTRLERVTCPLQEGRSASDELRRRAGEAGLRTPGRRGAVTRCRPGSPALRGQGHKPCVTALLPGKDSNLDSRGSEPRGLPS
jgi:hypothetical protein